MLLQQLVTAVFDIGKTNKKFFLLDQTYQVVYEEITQFEEVTDEDDFPSDDIQALTQWVKVTLENARQADKFQIRAVNVSAYGASLVHVDEPGNSILPLYNYLKPLPENIEEQFYFQYGGKELLAQQTASPSMGMLNSGLQLYWLKHTKPSLYNQVRYSLHLPQYLSLVTGGQPVSEITSIGCHTALWDFQQNRHHLWVEKEKLASNFPHIKKSNHSLNALYRGQPVKVGVGIHDSSAALVPYLRGMDEPFVLLSTGTWSIAMNPFNDEPLSDKELHQDCLCYLSYEGRQVKSARIFIGSEHEHQVKRLAEHFRKQPNAYQQVTLQAEIIKQLIEEGDRKKQLVPRTLVGSGPYPQAFEQPWDLSNFSTLVEAYHQLIMDMVSMQEISLKLAIGNTKVKKIVITGGFANNKLFRELLSDKLPDYQIYTAELDQASTIGAAMMVQETSLLDPRSLLKLRHHSSQTKMGMEDYHWNPVLSSENS